MKSVMNHNFSNVQQPQLERSTLDRSFAHKTTFDAAQLIPFFWDEILPGDMIQLKTTVLARLQSLLYPLMDNLRIETFFFFIPNRLVWEHWEPFITGNDATPGVQTEYLVPIVGDDGSLTCVEGSLGDYFGIPIGNPIDSDTSPVSALLFRGYNLVWNEFFRDENLQEEVPFDTGDGPDGQSDYVILKRGKRKDYFTSAFLTPQKGPAVTLPLGTLAPIIGNGQATRFADSKYLYYSNNTGFNQQVGVANVSGPEGGAPTLTGITTDDKYMAFSTNPANTTTFADLSAATAATVEQLRQAFAFQAIQELDQRGGSRYTEYLQSTWQQRPEDFRLQRPEYLGGGSRPININAVTQTSGTPATPSIEPGSTPQATLAAHAQGTVQNGFNKSFVEHGYVLGLVNVTADITYQQGLHRSWSRQTRFDFPHPLLMHLGEQPIFQREIWTNNIAADNTIVWGYQERWAEFKYKPSYVTAKFRSEAVGSLDAWHLALDFATAPNLGAAFIVDDPPIDRVIAVTNEPHIICDTYTSYRHTRAMPVYSTPGLMGRF